MMPSLTGSRLHHRSVPTLMVIASTSHQQTQRPRIFLHGVHRDRARWTRDTGPTCASGRRWASAASSAWWACSAASSCFSWWTTRAASWRAATTSTAKEHIVRPTRPALFRVATLGERSESVRLPPLAAAHRRLRALRLRL